MTRYAPFASLASLLILASSCGSQQGTPSHDASPADATSADAAPEQAADARPDQGPDAQMDLPVFDAPPPMDECDPILQDCPTGKRCQYTCPSRLFTCIVDDGTRLHGESCSESMAGMHCVKGTACGKGFPGTTGSVCLAYCRVDTDCPAGKTCAAVGPTCASGQPLRIRVCNP